jgi:hypothetical protein
MYVCFLIHPLLKCEQKEGVETVKDGGIADDVKLASKGAEANSAGVDSIDAKRLKNDLDAVVVQVSYHMWSILA